MAQYCHLQAEDLGRNGMCARARGKQASFSVTPDKVGSEEAVSLAGTKVFSSISAPAIGIKRFAELVHCISGVVFVIVGTALLFVVRRYRSRSEDEIERPLEHGGPSSGGEQKAEST